MGDRTLNMAGYAKAVAVANAEYDQISTACPGDVDDILGWFAKFNDQLRTVAQLRVPRQHLVEVIDGLGCGQVAKNLFFPELLDNVEQHEARMVFSRQ